MQNCKIGIIEWDVTGEKRKPLDSGCKNVLHLNKVLNIGLEGMYTERERRR